MATVIFIKEGRQNRSAMRAVINYCLQEYKTFDSKSKRRLVSGVNCDDVYSSTITRNPSRRLKSLRPNRRTKSLLNLRRKHGLVTRFWSRLTATLTIYIRIS